MHFDAAYSERVVLRDGRQVELRPIRADDKEQLRRGLSRLSEGSRYLRFFTAKDHLSEGELRYLTEVDGVDHFAIVAGTPPEDGPQVGLGVARFVRSTTDPEVAETAVVVLDDVQGQGLGTVLLSRLGAAATERGVRWFVSDFLARNEAIAQLLRDLYPNLEIHALGDGVLQARAELLPRPPRTEAPRTGPMRGLLGRAAEGMLTIQHRLKPDLEREP